MEYKKQYIGIDEVCQVIGCKQAKGYELIRAGNRELKAAGYFTISGKLPIAFFEEKVYGGRRAGSPGESEDEAKAA